MKITTINESFRWQSLKSFNQFLSVELFPPSSATAIFHSLLFFLQSSWWSESERRAFLCYRQGVWHKGNFVEQRRRVHDLAYDKLVEEFIEQSRRRCHSLHKNPMLSFLSSFVSKSRFAFFRLSYKQRQKLCLHRKHKIFTSLKLLSVA